MTSKPDWADKAAEELLSMTRLQLGSIYVLSDNEALALTAARLRLVHCEGIGLGLQKAREAIS